MQVYKRHALCNAVGGISFVFDDILVNFSGLLEASHCGVILLVSVHAEILSMCVNMG